MLKAKESKLYSGRSEGSSKELPGPVPSVEQSSISYSPHTSQRSPKRLLSRCARFQHLKKLFQGTSLAVQWLRLRTSTAGGTGLIPGRGTKIPHAVRCGQKKLS